MGHLRSHGFSITTEHRDDLRPIKARHGIPAELESCHTALVGGYVVEGHVPGDVVQRLLRERPPIVGVAVPGMPIGSPGMEMPGQAPARYEVFSFDRAGKRAVFARR